MSGVKFDKDGRLILPEPVKKASQEQKRREKEAKEFDKKLTLNYLGSETKGFMRCEFEIELPKGVKGIKKKIFDVRDWTDKNVKLKKGARIWFEKKGEGYRLIISGRGADERCTWCRSFRTALKTSMFDLKVAVYQNNFCSFDEKRLWKNEI